MNSRFVLMVVVAAVLVGAGCSRAWIRTPVAGDIPKLSEEDIRTINGLWAGDGYSVATRVKDTANGIVEVVFLIAEKDEIRVERMDAYFRETPAGLVASYKEDGSEYVFLRIARAEHWIAIFLPEVDAIRGAVRAGALKGTIERDKDGKEGKNVTLNELGPDDFARAEKGGLPPAGLFSRDPLVILTRVSEGFKK